MQGFKRSTRPNLQSLREWLQHVATHPSLIKLPWVPAAEELWQQWPQPAADPGGLVRQLAQPQIHTDVAPWTLAHLEAELGGVCTSCSRPVACGGEDQAPSSHTTVGTCGDNRGPALGTPCPPRCRPALLRLWDTAQPLSWGWNSSLLTGHQLSAFKSHQPGCRKSHWL